MRSVAGSSRPYRACVAAVSRQLNRLGRLGLHAKRQLVALDPGVELGLVNPRKKMAPVELAEVFELALLPRRRNARGRLQIRNRLHSAVELRPLIDRRHETRSPVPRAAGDCGTRGVLHHHETRQVGILAPEPIGHPASERRTTRERRARVHLADTANMIEPVGPARLDHRQVVCARRDVREPVRNPDPALSVLLPFSPGCQKRRAAFAHRCDHRFEARGQRLPGQTVERGLGIERVDVARTTFHEQEDDTSRRCRMPPGCYSR